MDNVIDNCECVDTPLSIVKPFKFLSILEGNFGIKVPFGCLSSMEQMVVSLLPTLLCSYYISNELLKINVIEFFS